jgi:methylphosphotriester-DNA--protein-cysteine methyltransferase
VCAPSDPRADPQASRISEDFRWRAVVARDRTYDGRFYYSVATTGVYCRPSCAARRANPQNVRFHETCADAELVGFRPCKRCRPNGSGDTERHAVIVTQVCRTLGTAEVVPSLTELARAHGLSPSHFHRLFKSLTGLTSNAYAKASRAQGLRDALGRRDTTVTAAIYDAGVGSSGRFYETSDEMLGMTPTRYRAGGAGVEIRFAIGECSLGAILVARSERGVCAVLLGDDPDRLTRATYEIDFPMRPSSAATETSRPLSPKSSVWWTPPGSAIHFRSISAARHSSSACGRRSALSPPARRRPIRKSQCGSDRPRRLAPWRALARRIHLPWPSPAIVWCEPMAACPATAGASRASAHCSTKSARRSARAIDGRTRALVPSGTESHLIHRIFVRSRSGLHFSEAPAPEIAEIGAVAFTAIFRSSCSSRCGFRPYITGEVAAVRGLKEIAAGSPLRGGHAGRRDER